MRYLLGSLRLLMDYLLKVTPLTMTKRFERLLELFPKLENSRRQLLRNSTIERRMISPASFKNEGERRKGDSKDESDSFQGYSLIL